LLFNLSRVLVSMPFPPISVFWNDSDFYLSHVDTKKYARPDNGTILHVSLDTYDFLIVESNRNSWMILYTNEVRPYRNVAFWYQCHSAK
jgi:hypothetical protein